MFEEILSVVGQGNWLGKVVPSGLVSSFVSNEVQFDGNSLWGSVAETEVN